MYSVHCTLYSLLYGNVIRSNTNDHKHNERIPTTADSSVTVCAGGVSVTL